MNEQFSDDYYQIIYSEDALELYEQCVQSYRSEERLKFLKYLRDEFSTTNMNNLFDDFVEGIPNLDERKMEKLRIKMSRLEDVKLRIIDSINNFSSPYSENIIVHVNRAIHIPLESAKKDSLLEMLYEKLSPNLIETSLNNFKQVFQSTSFEPIKWNGTDAELKGLMELLVIKFNFNFGSRINIMIKDRFYKEQGIPYNLSSLRKCKFRNVVENDPRNTIYIIVDEIKNQIS